MFEVTDENNKVFHVDMNQFVNITTDMESEDNKSFATIADYLDEKDKTVKVETVLTDSTGKVIDLQTILDEIKEDSSKTPAALDVTFESTHSGKNKNFANYQSDSMEHDADSWMDPYKKPFLKNHDSHSEPLGRVKDFQFGQSEINPARDCIDVTYRITDKDAIPKILDGRYKTMSVGASVNHIKCDICGKDILKDGAFKFCGHWRGEKYKDEICTWTMTGLGYKEGSVVNMPADDWAQIKRVQIVTKDPDGKDEKTGDPKKSTTDETNLPKGKDDPASSIFDNIDKSLNPEGSKLPVGDDDKDKIPKDPKANTDPKDDTHKTEPPETDPVLIAKAKDEEIAKLGTKIADLTTEKTTIQTSLDESIEKLTTITKQLSDKNNEAEVLNRALVDTKKQCFDISNYTKSMIVDKIINYEILSKAITDADKVNRKNELTIKSTKDLNDMASKMDFTKIVFKTQPITPAIDPSLKNNKDNSSIDETDETDSTDENKSENIMDFLTPNREFEEKMIGTLNRRIK